MGQKINPIIFRIGNGAQWTSRWFSHKNLPALLREDVTARKFIKKQLPDAGIARIEVARSADTVTITIFTSKPGVIIGRGGAGIEELKNKLQGKILKNGKVTISIQEVRQPSLSAEIMVQQAIAQIEKRMPFRRVLKQTVSQVMEAGAKGVKVVIAGRLNGSEIARTEKLAQGAMPLHTIRAEIDYSRGVAHTTYGTIGIKVWINKGDRLQNEQAQATQQEEQRPAYRRNNRNR